MGGIPLMWPWRLFHWLLRGMNALAYWDLMVCLTFMYIVWVRTVHKINFNPLGAGKATLISVLTGLYEPTSGCLLYTSPSPRDATLSRMPSSA